MYGNCTDEVDDDVQTSNPATIRPLITLRSNSASAVNTWNTSRSFFYVLRTAWLTAASWRPKALVVSLML